MIRIFPLFFASYCISYAGSCRFETRSLIKFCPALTNQVVPLPDPKPQENLPWTRYVRYTGIALLSLWIFVVLWVLFYRFADPPGSYLTFRDRQAGMEVDRRLVALDNISAHLPIAVMTAEDQRFCMHNGFDWEAIDKASTFNEQHDHRTRGASTVSMQTAKNAFLWPARSWIRKGTEAIFTLLIEAFWPKERIMEVYLNIAEWGPGIFGAEAAAQHYFSKPASDLSTREAALLAAALPSPLRSNPARPSGYLSRRAHSIQGEMHDVARTFGHCLNSNR